MSESTSKHFVTPEGEHVPSELAPDVAAAASLESREIRAGLEGIAETLAELQTKALLSALDASAQKKKTKAPDRTLTKEGALKKIKALRDIRSRLKSSEGNATEAVADIRAKVKPDDLQSFDDALYDWVNAKA